jgi:hypothetical protein
MRCFALALLAASSLQADPLGDLRAALQKLQGREAIKARAEVASTSQDGSGKKARTRQSRSAILLEDGPAGLRLGWTAEQVEAARGEARKRKADPEAPTPNLDALRALNAEDAAELLGAAPALLGKLAQAKVLEDRPEAKEMMKKYDQRLKVWLDADGAPLGSEESLEFKGSKFRISFGGTSKEHATFRRVGGRLVVERSSKETSGSGMGFSSSGRTVVTVAVL